MDHYDKRVDLYIEKARPFAQPILIKMRALVHKACPDVTETIKWGMPSFEYKGPMFGFAAFKAHCSGSFWKAELLKDPHQYLGLGKNKGGEAMGNLGRITSLSDLPPDRAMIDFIRQHVKLNEAGIKPEKRKPLVKKVLAVPPGLMKAFEKNKKAGMAFHNLSPSHQREYVEWITAAKTEATRSRRVATAVTWLAEGKTRNWKYKK